MTDYEAIATITLPTHVITTTQKWLLSAGHLGNEAFVLWAGKPETAGSFLVTEAVFPKQTPFRSRHGIGVHVPGDELARLGRWLYSNRLWLIAQVHAHPGAAYHSDTDDHFPMVTAQGQFSVVVPNFARVMDPYLKNCAVYRLTSEGEWILVPQDNVQRILRVV